MRIGTAYSDIEGVPGLDPQHSRANGVFDKSPGTRADRLMAWCGVYFILYHFLQVPVSYNDHAKSRPTYPVGNALGRAKLQSAP